MTKWARIQLGEIASPEDGSIAIGPFGSAMKADTYTEIGVPIIRGTNISSTRAWKGDWVFIPESFADAMPRCVVKPNDIVFPHRGSIGEVAIVPPERDRYFLSSSLMKVRIDHSKADPLFVYYYFRSDAGRAQILRFASQVGTPGIGQPLSSLRQFILPLPPLEDQTAIASVLATLDDKIELNRRMNETLEAMARAIFKDWFVDFGPTRAKMEGRAVYLAPDIWSLFPNSLDADGKPETWSRACLGDLAEQIAMGPFGSNIKVETFVESGVPIISGAHLRGMRLSDGNYNFVSIEHADRLSRSNVARGDVIFTHAGNIGQVAIIPDTSQYERYVVSQRQFYMRCNRDLISPMYVVHFFHTAEGQHALLANASQVGVPSIARPATYLKSIEISCPPKALLSEFEAVVGNLHRKAASNLTENNTLAATRDLLLPKLMSGEIRIKDAEKIAGEAA